MRFPVDKTQLVGMLRSKPTGPRRPTMDAVLEDLTVPSETETSADPFDTPEAEVVTETPVEDAPKAKKARAPRKPKVKASKTEDAKPETAEKPKAEPRKKDAKAEAIALRAAEIAPEIQTPIRAATARSLLTILGRKQA